MERVDQYPLGGQTLGEGRMWFTNRTGRTLQVGDVVAVDTYKDSTEGALQTFPHNQENVVDVATKHRAVGKIIVADAIILDNAYGPFIGGMGNKCSIKVLANTSNTFTAGQALFPNAPGATGTGTASLAGSGRYHFVAGDPMTGAGTVVIAGECVDMAGKTL